MAPVLEVADIFRRHGEAFRQVHAGHLGCVERRIMGAITACRTAALGGHVEQCDDCGATRIAYNSCRNRHCPKWQGAARERWRAELGAAFEAGDLKFFGDLTRLAAPQAFAQRLADLRGADWVVYAKPPFGGPEQVLAYLARYTHRVAIANSRIVSLDDGRVGFTWKNYRCAGQTKVMTLEAHEFIRRFLLHVLPDGFHRIRHYGYLANGGRADNLARCRRLVGECAVNPQQVAADRDRGGDHLEIVFRFPVPNAAALFAASLRSRPIRGAVHPFTATRHEHRPCVRQARRFRHGELRTRDRSRLALHLVANRTPTRITTKPSRTMPDPTQPATDNSSDPLDAIRRRASRRRSDTAFPIAANIPRLRSIRLL